MSSLARKLLILFAVMGLGASAAATWVHYHLIENPDYSSFCDINATVSCKEAYLSRYGSLAGVPVAVGGLIFFVWILIMIWGSRGSSRMRDSAPGYIFAASTLALAAVLYLAYASFFILKEVCPLCVTTYVAVIGVFAISGGASSVPMSTLPKRAMHDIRVLVTTPVALVVALLFVAGASWGMTAFPREESRPVIQQAAPITAAQQTEFERWWEMQPTTTVPFDNAGAKVLIVEFSDLQCPHCRAQYFAYKPILDKYTAHPEQVKFLMKHWPISSECNPGVPSNPHPAACAAAAAVVMGRAKGTSDKLIDYFFLHQDDLTPESVRRAAADVGKITNFDAQYQKALQEVKTDVALGTALGVNSTPTFFVNGRRIPQGGVPAQYLEPLIQIELQKAK
jgi:uncharacterized membrane protein